MSRKKAIQVIEQYAEACISCGICQNSCPLRLSGQLTPLEIARQVLDGNVTQRVVDLIQRCDLCGLCSEDCPVNLNPGEMASAAREVLLDQSKINLEDYATMLVDQDWNFASLYCETFDIHYQNLKRESYNTLFFPGCSLATYSPDLTRAAFQWLDEQGMAPGFSELCCGKPLSSIGLTNRASQLHRFIEQQMSIAGAAILVTACPNCYNQLSGRLGDIQVVSLYHLMRESGMQVKSSEKLTIHDSCSDRATLSFAEDLRALLPSQKLVEMEHNHKNALCCGSGGIVSMIDPELCQQRAQIRLHEFTASGAERMVTGCMSCAHRLARADTDVPLAHFLELAFGIPVDYSSIQANLESMWEGTLGELNHTRLSQSRLFTNCEDEPHA